MSRSKPGVRRRINIAFISIIVAAILLRIVVMAWSTGFRENTDILRYKDWGLITYLHGVSSSYKQDYLTFGMLPNNQPPGSTYIISCMYWIYMMTSRAYSHISHTPPGSNQFINGPLLTIFLKIPSAVADIVGGMLLYLIVATLKGKRTGMLAMLVYEFHPIILYNSVFWGQMDGIVTLPFILTLVFFMKNRPFPGWLSYILSLYIKLTYAYVLPVILIYSIKRFGLRKSMQYLCIGIAIITLTTFPISSNPLAWFIDYLKLSAGGEMQEITNYAWNFWWMVYRPQIFSGSIRDGLYTFSEIMLKGSPLSSSLFLTIPLSLWGFIFYLTSLIPFVYKLTKRQVISIRDYSILMVISCLMAYMFIPRMHERYLYGVFPFLIILTAFQRKYIVPVVLLSSINFVNLYTVWHPLFIDILVPVIISQTIQWYMSVIFVITSGITYAILFQDFVKNKA